MEKPAAKKPQESGIARPDTPARQLQLFARGEVELQGGEFGESEATSEEDEASYRLGVDLSA